jgi:hypothetical protein
MNENMLAISSIDDLKRVCDRLRAGTLTLRDLGWPVFHQHEDGRVMAAGPGEDVAIAPVWYLMDGDGEGISPALTRRQAAENWAGDLPHDPGDSSVTSSVWVGRVALTADGRIIGFGGEKKYVRACA